MSNWKNIWARWGSGDGETDAVRMDPVTNVLAGINSEHYHMHEGDHYFFKNFITDDAVFSFTTPNTTTRIHAKALISPDLDYTITIFEGATVSGGTPLDGINNDRDSVNVAELTALGEPTIDVAGTAIWTARNGGGRNPVGVAPGFSYEIIAKTNTTYVFTITRNVANAGVADIDFWWYEEAPKH